MGCHCAKDRCEDLDTNTPKESLARCQEKLEETKRGQTKEYRSPVQRRKTVLLTTSPIIEPIQKLLKPIAELYLPDSTLTSCESQSVIQATFLGTKQKCVLTTVARLSGRSILQQRTRFSAEALRLYNLDHPLVLRTLEVMQDDKHFYLATEPYSGGRMKDYAGDQTLRTESFVAKVGLQLLGALSYCHRQGVVHGNLSLESLVLMERPKSDCVKVKLSGFGELDSVPSNSKDRENYAAPEAVQGPTAKSDIWSCGVILYVLLTGQLPFPPEKPGSNRTRRRSSTFPVIPLEGDGKGANSLIASMLDRDPENRPTAAQCLSNPWLRQFISPPTMKTGVVNTHLFSLRKLHNRNPLQEAVLKFIVLRIVNGKELEAPTEAFFVLDKDEDGMLSEEELRLSFLRALPEADAVAATRRAIEAAEHNGYSCIGYTEFVISSLGEKKLMSPANLRTVFSCFDPDGSGRISLRELRSAFTVRHSSERERQWRELILQASGMGEDRIDYGGFVAITGNFDPNS